MITKKRKYSLVLLSLMLILSACGGSDTAEEEVVEEVVEETLESPATTAAQVAPADAEQWNGVPNKYEEHFSEKPGKGD